MSWPQLPKLLTVAEVADALSVHPKTIRRMIKRGELVVHKVGKRNVRVDASSVTHLLAPPVTTESDTGVPLTKNKDFASQPRLLRQRGRTQVWTAEINGLEVPLGTSDQLEAEAALDDLLPNVTQEPAGKRSWRIYTDPSRGGLIAKYYDREGRRRLHRIPASIEAGDDAERYMGGWYAEHVGRPQVPTRIVESRLPAAVTFEQFGQLWTSGKLAQMFPDHVKLKATASDDESRLRLYVYPWIGSVRVSAFDGRKGLELVERVVHALPSENFSKASRRQVLQAVNRLLSIAAYPAKLISGNPLPKGFLPKVGKGRAKSYLYPSEDAKLMACEQVPLLHRFFYGFIIREGLRVGEATALTWRDLDLDIGVIVLEETKTDESRSWALDPGVAEALRRWKKRLGSKAKDNAPVLVDAQGRAIDKFAAADRLRRYLELAGVERSQLYEASGKRLPIRAHDLRASFVTVSLALGRTEAWITDRTGHRSSQMIYTYKRSSRTQAELSLGSFAPLWQAIPELRDP